MDADTDDFGTPGTLQLTLVIDKAGMVRYQVRRRDAPYGSPLAAAVAQLV